MSDFILELPPGGDVSSGSVVSPADAALGERDHALEAERRLVLQFRKPRFKALLRRCCGPIQKFEHIAIQVLVALNVDNAQGFLLDAFGKLVGQPRGDADDELYRRMIRARIRANRSKGTRRDILAVARLFFPETTTTLRVKNMGNATFRLRITGTTFDQELQDALMSFLRVSVSAGVRFILEVGTVPVADAFTVGSVHGGTFPGLGIGSVHDTDMGGKFNHAVE